LCYLLLGGHIFLLGLGIWWYNPLNGRED